MGGGGAGEIVGRQLLDAQRDAFLLHIDVQHLHLDHIALLVGGDRLLARLLPIEIGEMDHAVDLSGQAHEQPELRDVLDLAGELAARRMLVAEGAPGVLQALLQA